MKLLAILAAALLIPAPAAPGSASAPSGAAPSDARDVFDQAAAAFESGLAALESDGQRAARPHFATAADLYERIRTQHGIDNAAIGASAGNAWLLAGRPGEAVLAYRRALQLDPSHEVARAGLAQARAAVGVEIPAAATLRWRDRAVGAVAIVGPGRLLWLGAGMWVIGWVIFAAGLWQRPLARLWPAGAAAAVAGALSIATVAAAAWLLTTGDQGVIIAEHVEARLGPGAAAYEPAFDAPLAAGVEVRVLERRAGWARVALLDGREAWVPGESVATLQ